MGYHETRSPHENNNVMNNNQQQKAQVPGQPGSTPLNKNALNGIKQKTYVSEVAFAPQNIATTNKDIASSFVSGQPSLAPETVNILPYNQMKVPSQSSITPQSKNAMTFNQEKSYVPGQAGLPPQIFPQTKTNSPPVNINTGSMIKEVLPIQQKPQQFIGPMPKPGVGTAVKESLSLTLNQQVNTSPKPLVKITPNSKDIPDKTNEELKDKRIHKVSSKFPHKIAPMTPAQSKSIDVTDNGENLIDKPAKSIADLKVEKDIHTISTKRDNIFGSEEVKSLSDADESLKTKSMNILPNLPKPERLVMNSNSFENEIPTDLSLKVTASNSIAAQQQNKVKEAQPEEEKEVITERAVRKKIEPKKKARKEDVLNKLFSIAGDSWEGDDSKGNNKEKKKKKENKFKCPEPDGYFSDPIGSCFLYYRCVHGKATSFKCGEGLRWNSETEQCDWGTNVQCLKT